jgi:hypothetical protein
MSDSAEYQRIGGETYVRTRNTDLYQSIIDAEIEREKENQEARQCIGSTSTSTSSAGGAEAKKNARRPPTTK